MNWNEFNFEGLANALLLLIVGVLGAFGVGQHRKGKSAEPQTETMELAGAVISDRAADSLIKSMDALAASNTMLTHATNLDTDAKKALTQALTENSASSDRLVTSKNDNLEVIRANTQAARSVAEQAHDLRDRIGELAKELEIQSRLRRSKE